MDLSKARDGSLAVKYLSVALMVFGTIMIGLGVFPGLTVYTLGTACVFIVALFSDVSLNLLIEKFVGKKPESQTNPTQGVPG